MLTSPWCFSACDTFSAALRGNKLATFIGEAIGEQRLDVSPTLLEIQRLNRVSANDEKLVTAR